MNDIIKLTRFSTGQIFLAINLIICLVRVFNPKILIYISDCEAIVASENLDEIETDVNIKV